MPENIPGSLHLWRHTSAYEFGITLLLSESCPKQRCYGAIDSEVIHISPTQEVAGLVWVQYHEHLSRQVA